MKKKRTRRITLGQALLSCKTDDDLKELLYEIEILTDPLSLILIKKVCEKT